MDDDRDDKPWPYEGLSEKDANLAAALEINVLLARTSLDSLAVAVRELERVRADQSLVGDLRTVAIRRVRKECRERAAARHHVLANTAKALADGERRSLESPEVAGNRHFGRVLRELLAVHGDLAYAHAECEYAGRDQNSAT